MIGTADTYFQRSEVSNSDLSELNKYLMNKEQLYDIEQAYRFGNLIDAMITEPHRCDHLNFRVDEEQFNFHEWGTAKKMLQAFRADPFCMNLLSQSTGQNVKDKYMPMEYEGFNFVLPVRCKYDLWMELMKWGSDIKSTAATTQKQFEAAIQYFDYDRQRAFYMDISGADKDMLIGISKINFKIFKVPITRESDLYKKGREKYLDLAFKYYCLFEGF